ncbi:GldG family protein [Leucobacter allii]|uniref:N,N-dimethylformamidase beta subunit family domain-containing protein n=1 Tax=Leucobacter allii TaxID=2932247 RepID=UPI001FD469B8|nr:GldG family protein [Leucobacter allii]UOR01943.1 GldG family protein [Leucobacter allii]
MTAEAHPPTPPETPPADYAWSLPGGLIEKPGHAPELGELWCYTDEFSYAPGAEVPIRVHTTASAFDIRVVRDGAIPQTVYEASGVPGTQQSTPANAYEAGCGWTESLRIVLDSGWQPGFYLIVVGAEHRGRRLESEGFFIVRAEDAASYDFALIHATSTMLAYNDWGGANHYRGLPDGHLDDIPSPVVSSRRPIARGMLRKPAEAPRNAHADAPPPDWEPRYPPYEWAWHRRYSRHHADAGWASYERPFTVWAEGQGYRVAHLTQTDLQLRPEALDGFSAAVIVGHDEYWSWEMRDTIDAFVDRGGSLARFGGNYVWQVRLDDTGTQQTCYKDASQDPMLDHDVTRVTTMWDWDRIGRPGAQTMGLSGIQGSYIRYGNAVPRASGGFTVYRPDHWVFAGTALEYGDVFGAAPFCIAAFEVDGVDYTFRRGLPYPTFADGAPETLEILALTPAVAGQRDRWGGRVPIGAPIVEAVGLIDALYDGAPPAHLRDQEYGSAMIATFTRGRGRVLTAGTTEWVNGLILGDAFTAAITKNVLDEFCTAAKGNDHADH